MNIENRIMASQAKRQLQESRREEVKNARAGNVSVETREIATKIYRVFQSFSRGGIVNPEGTVMQRIFESRINTRSPIETILFWGASNKPMIDSHDVNFIQRLENNLQHPVKDLYSPGMITHVVIGDVHIIANGYTDQSTGELSVEARKYLGDVGKAFAQSTLATDSIWLSTLHDKYKIPAITANPSPIAYAVFDKHRDFLLANAQNHSLQENPIAAALLYVDTRIREKELLAREFGGAILVATGIRKAAEDIILPAGMPGVFSKDLAPWFQMP